MSTTTPAPTYVEEILDAARTSTDTVLADPHRTLTGAELEREVCSLARALRSLDVEPGTVLGLVTDNVCAALTVRYAAQLVGVPTVQVPTADDPAELAGFLDETGVTTAVVTGARAAVLAAALRRGGSRVSRVLSAGAVDPCQLRVEADVLALASGTSGERVASVAAPNDLCSLVTSGGTTGTPKASLRTFADWRALVAGRPDRRRRQLVCTPLAYVAQVLADQTLLGGGSVVLRPATSPFDAAEVLRTVEAERITHLGGLVEPALVALLDHVDLARRDLSSLVGITHIGADACPTLRTRLWLRARSAGLGDVLVHAYGSSEVGLVSVLAGTDYSGLHPELLATTGRLLPGVEVRVEQPQGGTASSGTAGEIVVRSAGVCAGTSRYAGPAVDPASDPAWFPAGDVARQARWRRTGDWGSLDDDGRLTVRGRLDDAVPGADEPLFPVDVQESLCRQPAVRYAVALPSPARTGFGAVVVLRPGTASSPEELLARTPARLRLERVVVVGRVPVTEQGKPDRRALAALLSPTDRRSTAEAVAS